MDTRMEEQQQKDYMASFFPNVDLDRMQGEDMMHHHPSQQQNQALMHGMNMPPQLDMEMLGNLMSMQGIDSSGHHPMSATSPSQTHFPTGPNPTNASTPQSLMEQQFKLAQLQQLQQLQNQIFQQQMALISGGQGSNADTPVQEPVRERQANFHGLPTPGSSTELRAQQQPLEYVSPMILNYMDPADNYPEAMTPMPHSMNPQYPVPPRGAASAPAHIVFRTHSSADIDVDISPLTSPWLGAQPSYPQRNKRTASSSGDESTSKPSKKRQSPAIRPYNPTPAPKRPTKHSKSTTNTPLLRSARSRTGSIAGHDVVDDSPSPVDLSMPPPAMPSSMQMPPPESSSNAFSSPSLTPVTPASIMNLGRLGVNSTNNLAPKPQDKGKAPARGSAAAAPQRSKSTRRASIGASSALKPILSAASAPASVRNTTGAPVVQVRKTSHKAAEQKRRDSLKTTFDELRGLLPPIPLPSDGRNHDEPMLPGALPPRGPPKAGTDGPNKAVSKLQLLMCGNDFIRQLKGRVERRDDEIHLLRQEVGRLRGMVGPGIAEVDDGERLDLDRDLDEIEALTMGFARGTLLGVDEDADEEGDGED